MPGYLVALLHSKMSPREHTRTSKSRRLPLFVCVDALRPSQQYFSHVKTISCFPGLNQYLAEDKVYCPRTHHSAFCES